jgi:TRAP-type C4-dicarboxylate transport system permease small subunit
MSDEVDRRGASRAQRVAAAPFVLVAALVALGLAGLVVADVVLRYAASAPMIWTAEAGGLAVLAILAVGLPAATILGIRSGGPFGGPPARSGWGALHTAILFLLEAVILAFAGLMLLGGAFQRFAVEETTQMLRVPVGLPQTAVALGLLVAALVILAIGAIRLVRGR